MKDSYKQSLKDLPESLRCASVKYKRRHKRKTGVRPYSEVLASHEQYRQGEMKKIIKRKVRRLNNQIENPEEE